jgi:SAM-dependent methyltransferase
MKAAPPRKLSAIEAQLFGIRWSAEYLARFSARRLLRKRFHRTPEAVVVEYEGMRRRYLERFRAQAMPLDDYLVSEADDSTGARYLQILDGHLYAGALIEATKNLQLRLIEAVDSYKPQSVVEFGCGAGRNLLAIKRACPHVRCIGFELTLASVEMARLAAQCYKLELEIHAADITQPITNVEEADVCFSVHALEQIPDSRSVFEQMYRIACKSVVLFEPIVELYRWTPCDIAARIRARHLDRLRGLYRYILRQGYKVGTARLVDATSNALNRTAEIHILCERHRSPQQRCSN